jgi:hypothetical protein
MGKWNFDDIENSLVNDAEKRITRGYQQPSDGGTAAAPSDATAPARGQVPGSYNLAGAPARGQSLGSVPMPTDSPQAAEQIIGLKGPDTKGVQTYLPLKDYMRLMQQKTLRKQNIAQIAGEAIIDWLDRQEQSPSASGQK